MPHEELACRFVNSPFSSNLPSFSFPVDRTCLGDEIPSNWDELCDLIGDLCGELELRVPSIFFYTRVAYECLKSVSGKEAKLTQNEFKLAFDEYERTTATVITPITSKDQPKQKSETVQKKESGIVFHVNSDSFGWSNLVPLNETDFRGALNYSVLGLVDHDRRVSEKYFTKDELIHQIHRAATAIEESEQTQSALQQSALQSIILSLHVLSHLYLAFSPPSALVGIRYD